MPLTPGQTLTHYEILGPLGAGGMGEVYRARDVRLQREVAIKVLPEHFAEDEERLRRFEREARTLASLSHANLAHVYGIDQVEDTCFLAMELVPGEDLATRLAQGPLPLREALDVCRQIAEGLEAAHEAGVVHRDLKPANIRVTPEGVVKVLDFGLAKPIGPRAKRSGSGTSTSESDSFLVTEEGMVLGTPTYMSPEQARGRLVDRRTDIWAFGCVLYECLTGKRAFEGQAFGDLIAAIVQHEVDLDTLPRDTPAPVRRLVERTLAKDSRTRLRDIGEARVVLEEVLAGRSPAEPARASGEVSSRSALLPWTIAAVALVAGGLAVARLFATSHEPAAAPRQLRFTIRCPDPDAFEVHSPVVAHDGSFVAFIAVGRNRSSIWLRELDQSAPRQLPGTEEANYIFLSPDDRFIGFHAGGKLKKVAVDGGTPVTIGDAVTNPGGAWAADGRILYSPTWTSGLASIPADGGPVLELTQPDASAGETAHWWPTPLPGNKRILYTVFTVDGTLNQARIKCLDLDTNESRFVANGAQPVLVGPGHLLYFHAGAYELAPFDAESAQLTGPPVTVLEDLPLLHAAGDTWRFVAFGDDGTMAWIGRTSRTNLAPRHWFWLDRAGELDPIDLPSDVYGKVALSPDGRKLALARIVAGEPQIFVHDLETGSETQITTEKVNEAPRWSPDGKRIMFDSLARGTFDVFGADPSGVHAPEPLYVRDGDAFGGSFTPDGKGILSSVSHADTAGDIVLVDLTTGDVRTLVATPRAETKPRLSPGGDLMAFTSNVAGAMTVFLASFDDPSKVVRVGRGDFPNWTANGTRLMFFGESALWTADVRFDAGEIHVDEPVPYVASGLSPDEAARLSSFYGVSSDDSRVLVSLLDQPTRADVEVVVDGFSLLGIR